MSPTPCSRRAASRRRSSCSADYGYSTPSTMIEGLADYVDKNPDITKRFVEASIIGWYNYLYGDNAATNELIKKENPDINDEFRSPTRSRR